MDICNSSDTYMHTPTQQPLQQPLQQRLQLQPTPPRPPHLNQHNMIFSYFNLSFDLLI